MDFCGGPVLRFCASNSVGMCSIPSQISAMCHTLWPKKKKKKEFWRHYAVSLLASSKYSIIYWYSDRTEHSLDMVKHKKILVLVSLGLLLLLLSHFSRVWLRATPWTAAYQASLSVGFSRQEHWSGLPFLSPMHESGKWKWSRSVVSDSKRPHGLQPTMLLHPWDFPGSSTGVGCHCLLLSWPR